MKPRFPIAHLEMDRGIVAGAHQTPAIANALQQQVKAIVDEAFPRDDRLSLMNYGVSYHATLAHGARHVWLVHALNEEVQELVSQALEGRKLPMVETSVYKAAEELQGLQKGMIIFKATMKRILESDSNPKTRRAAARLLFTKKRDWVYQKADEELLAARGLNEWETADAELREARKHARTEATTAFLKAAEDTLKTLKHFVEGIDDAEHAKWALEQKIAVCHKAVELRHELRREFGNLVTLDPTDAYYMEDEPPPGPTYANPPSGHPPMGAMLIYAEEALDDGEIESEKLKKATVGDVITGAFKKAKVTIAEPAEANEPDMDEDVAMQDMESDEAYTNLYDKDEAVMEECQDEAMGDWEEMPPTLQKARKKKDLPRRRRRSTGK
jgi:hypothetical protein